MLFRTVALSRRGERQRDAEHRTAARVLVDGYAATVHVDRPFRDGQPQPGAAAVTRPGFIEAEEPIENPLPVFSRDSGALVGDRDMRL